MHTRQAANCLQGRLGLWNDGLDAARTKLWINAGHTAAALSLYPTLPRQSLPARTRFFERISDGVDSHGGI